MEWQEWKEKVHSLCFSTLGMESIEDDVIEPFYGDGLDVRGNSRDPVMFWF